MEAEGSEERQMFSNYQLLVTDLPDSILLHIFQYLPFSAICQVSKVCHRWHQVSSDELLWRSVFLWHYKLPFTTTLHKKATSWRSEFKRLYYHTPALLVEEFKEHKDEVLHVSFSHDGSMFATCSKDGYFMIWSTQSKPVRLLFKMDMKNRFNWQFTQFSQFNESDTCLLVSGVYSGPFTTSGEIAIFDLQDNFEIQSRVTNKPYDVFGAWFDNEHLLSGTIYSTGDLSSVSAIWISKASQEVESEVESVSMVLYRFQNINSSTVRLINVADIEKSDAVKEDTDKLVEKGETGLCNRSDLYKDFSEPSLLDKLLCREISEEEFDIDNEDCDDYSGDIDEAEWERKEEFYGFVAEESDVLTENCLASENMEWLAEDGKNAMKYLKPEGETASLDAERDHDCLCLHSMKACCVNVRDLYTCDSSTGDSINTCDSQSADSSNNASSRVPENVSASNNCNKLMDPLVSGSRAQCSSSLAVTYNSHTHSQSSLAENTLHLQARSSGLSFTPAPQNLDHFGAMLKGQQKLDCVETSELSGQDLRDCRGDEDESLDLAIHHDNKNEHFDNDWVDGNASSLFGFRGTSECLSTEGIDLSVGSGAREKVRVKNAKCQRQSVSPRPQCSSHLNIKEKSKLHIGQCEQVSSHPVSFTPCDNSIHPNNNLGVSYAHGQKSSTYIPQPSASKSAGCSVSVASSPKPCMLSSRKTFKQSCFEKRKSNSCKTPSSQSHGEQRQQGQCKHPPEKLLIYTWGSKTFTPHKIGIKRMKWTDFSKGEVTARRASMLPRVMENLQNGMEPTRRDEPDHSIEMHGHIVGLRVAPDQRYLYVNCRPWPKNYIISDPQESPPLAQEVEISTIDLKTLEFVGPVLRSHKAFTHSDDCFFLNLDVSEDFVASGAEDKQGYLWDRHYGILLYRFPHNNVVNCVAVNPKDPELLVTVSDDYSIKVWASRHRCGDIKQQSRPPSKGVNKVIDKF